MILLTAIVLAAYLMVLFLLWIGNDAVPQYHSKVKKPETSFSVLIPFRNESEALPYLLKSFIKMNYPKSMFELIFIDDDSDDDSAAIIDEALSHTTIQYRIIKNERRSGSPKKDAIMAGVSLANNDWIITTDADCIVPENWLLVFSNFIKENEATMIAGAVTYASDRSFIQNYQQLDGWSLQLTAIGSFGLNQPFLCNGANLAYKKDAFFAVHGYNGNDHIASGDDLFLLQKFIKEYPEKVKFLKSKETVVSTRPENSWKGIINQRIRWASKVTGLKNWPMFLMGSIIFLASLVLLCIPVLFALSPQKWLILLLFVVIKLIIDGLYLNKASNFFKGEHVAAEYLASFFIYPLITVIVTAGSLFGNYTWKGRTFKKQP